MDFKKGMTFSEEAYNFLEDEDKVNVKVTKTKDSWYAEAICDFQGHNDNEFDVYGKYVTAPGEYDD